MYPYNEDISFSKDTRIEGFYYRSSNFIIITYH